MQRTEHDESKTTETSLRKIDSDVETIGIIETGAQWIEIGFVMTGTVAVLPPDSIPGLSAEAEDLKLVVEEMRRLTEIGRGRLTIASDLLAHEAVLRDAVVASATESRMMTG